jgi:AcrR family transcriptional regulator
MSTASEPRRLRADAARNRQALIDAAERLFVERGLAVTLDDIAAAAGVNVATAYRHFANKHELAGAFLDQKIDQVIAEAEAAAAVADPWSGLTQFLSRMLALITANRGLHDVFTPGYEEERFQRLDARVEPLLRGVIGRAQAAGALRADVEVGDIGALVQVLGSAADIPAADPGALAERYLALVLAGLRPDGEPLPGRAPSPAQARAKRPVRPRRERRC